MRSVVSLALISGAAVMALSSCATTGGASIATPVDTPGFVAAAASSDLFEIESGCLALQRSRSPTVRMHAEMMLRDHNYASAQLRSVAATAGYGVPSGILPRQAALLAELARAGDFDATYRLQQVQSHREALTLMDRFARRGADVRLRGVAAAAIPVIRAHLDHATRM